MKISRFTVYRDFAICVSCMLSTLLIWFMSIHVLRVLYKIHYDVNIYIGIQRLMGCLLFVKKNLLKSPYGDLIDPWHWSDTLFDLMWYAL